MEIRSFPKDPENGQLGAFFENGQKMITAEFKNGKRHGTLTLWHQNGQKMLESEWALGVLQGRTTIWNPSGEVIHVAHYIQGQLLHFWSAKNSDSIPQSNEK